MSNSCETIQLQYFCKTLAQIRIIDNFKYWMLFIFDNRELNYSKKVSS